MPRLVERLPRRGLALRDSLLEVTAQLFEILRIVLDGSAGERLDDIARLAAIASQILSRIKAMNFLSRPDLGSLPQRPIVSTPAWSCVPKIWISRHPAFSHQTDIRARIASTS